MLIVMDLGGYIILRDHIPNWCIWGNWVSPLIYAQNVISVNGFLGHSGDKRFTGNSTLSLRKALLKSCSLFLESCWYWIDVGALIGYTILFNLLCTLSLKIESSKEASNFRSKRGAREKGEMSTHS